MKRSLLVRVFMLCLCGLSNVSFSAISLIPAKTALLPENLVPVTTPFVSTSSFAKYIQTCKEELGFEFIPQMDCRTINFRSPTNERDFQRANDWVSHLQLNSKVDVLFACRWVEKNSGASGTASGEMLVHNRANGNTCFFKLKVHRVDPEPGQDTSTGFLIFPADRNGSVLVQAPTTNPASPTEYNAEEFWEAPETIVDNDKDVCTRCHSAGPYIASPEIVGALAQFGLINDGHDVNGIKYKAVGAVFENKFNSYISQTIQSPSSTLATCANKCHLVGGNSTKLDTTASVRDSTGIVIPSINLIMNDILKGHMPPNNPFSDYRWINRDVPTSKGDYERLYDVKNEFSEIYESCKTPEYMQAHELDSAYIVATNDFVDVIDTFNLHDGLICLNANQPNGRCNNYETRYRCNGKWTTWQSHDSPASTGDHENRSSFSFPSTCTAPYAIQARYYIGNEAHVVNGPPDRLYQFNENGLICRNIDQPTGERCHDYTVRFICP